LASSNRWLEVLLIERALVKKWFIGDNFENLKAADIVHVPGNRLGQFVSLEKDEPCLKILSKIPRDDVPRFHFIDTSTDWVTFLDNLLVT
jgi:hypothetical protein